MEVYFFFPVLLGMNSPFRNTGKSVKSKSIKQTSKFITMLANRVGLEVLSEGPEYSVKVPF